MRWRVCPQSDVQVWLSKNNLTQVWGDSSLMVPSPSCNYCLVCRIVLKPGSLSGPFNKEKCFQLVYAGQGLKKHITMCSIPTQPLGCGELSWKLRSVPLASAPSAGAWHTPWGHMSWGREVLRGHVKSRLLLEVCKVCTLTPMKTSNSEGWFCKFSSPHQYITRRTEPVGLAASTEGQREVGPQVWRGEKRAQSV